MEASQSHDWIARPKRHAIARLPLACSDNTGIRADGKRSNDPITAHQTSRLLLLPAEIRNRIFEFVLTSGQTLAYRPTLFSVKPLILLQWSEFNQIKYVCKQLYRETAGREIQFNAVRFDGPDPDIPGSASGPTETFLAFAAQCTTQKQRWFSSVYLHTFPEYVLGISSEPIIPDYELLEPPPQLRRLAAFCADHPHIHVSYVVSGLNFEELIWGTFLPRARFLEAMLTHKVPPPPLFRLAPKHVTRALEWADDDTLETLGKVGIVFRPLMGRQRPLIEQYSVAERENMFHRLRARRAMRGEAEVMRGWCERGFRAGVEVGEA